MKIRKADLNDLPELIRLNQNDFDEIKDWSSLSQKEKWSIGLWWVDIELLSWYFHSLIESKGGIIVIEDTDKIIGQLDYSISFDFTNKFEGTRLHIVWLIIDKNYRGKGHAKNLINYLTTTYDFPIWVEAEDEKSDNLYKKIGKQIEEISNWELSIFDYNQINLPKLMKIEHSSLKQISKIFNKYERIIGRYYTPTHDTYQLINGHLVSEFIWGDTEEAKVIKMNYKSIELYAILTQYPRIFIHPTFNEDDFSQALNIIFGLIFDIGFDHIFIQIYNSSKINKLMLENSCKQIIQSDPIYQLN